MPLTISKGGTYSGEWDGVVITTAEPVRLTNFTIRNTGTDYIINAYHQAPSGIDLTIDHGFVYGADRWDGGRWLVAKEWKRLDVSNISIENTRGIELWPNAVANPFTRITRCFHRNPKGTTNGGTLGAVGNFIQLRVVGQTTPIEVSWNHILSEYGKSNAEDVFSIYKTAHTRIHDNLIEGQSKPPTFSGSSQNSITIDPHSEPHLLFDNQIVDNFVIDAYSIGMFGGNNNLLERNHIVSDGYWTKPDGGQTPMLYGFEGIWVAPGFTGNVARGNQVGYIGSQGRVDGRLNNAGDWTNNTHLSDPITRQTEVSHIQMFRQRQAQAGVTIGAGEQEEPPMGVLEDALEHLRAAKRISHTSNSYRKDNPGEYAKVIAYLDGGARPTGVTTDMGQGLLLVEDARRGDPLPPDPGTYLLDEQWASIDPARWQKKWWFNGDTYFHEQTVELQAWRDANAFVAGGVLNLVAKREDVTDFQGRPRKFTSGIVQTNGIQGVTPTPGPSYTFGKFEARIKSAPGLGMWSCFWLCDAGWPSYCPAEIDIVEIVGSDPNRAHMNFHVSGAGGGSSYLHGAALYDDFHVYGLEWRQNFLAWSFDGVEKFRYTGASIPTNPHYIILGLQVGGPGSWAGTPDPNTFTQATQFVDWVRVSA